MAKFSIIICCANSEDMLEETCKSATWADELIVVDSGSTDRTPEIAKKYADKYVEEPWRGHSEQKKFAAELGRNDWIFFLDGDEECSPELAEELNNLSEEKLDQYDLLLVPRKNYVLGRLARAWWPDELTRIFHRRRCTWSNHPLHDIRVPSHPSKVMHLKGWLVHKRLSQAGFSDYFSGKRMDDRLLPVAKEMYDKGKRCNWLDLAFRPAIAFIKFYFLKLGFLDGTFGLLIAQKAYVSTQLKYATLWAIQHDDATRKQSEQSTVAK